MIVFNIPWLFPGSAGSEGMECVILAGTEGSEGSEVGRDVFAPQKSGKNCWQHAKTKVIVRLIGFQSALIFFPEKVSKT